MKWRYVVGYGRRYQVSDTGCVKRCSRPNSRGFVLQKKILKPQAVGRTRHLYVTLTKKGKQKTIPVHTLVLEAFVGPRPKGMQARHYPDPNPANNQLYNLSWSTQSTNQLDRREHGTTNRGRGAKKLSDSEVRSIRRLREKGLSYPEIAKRFNVSWRTCWNIVNGKHYQEVSN